MAMITCSECKKQVSDKANACPNCGAPVKNITRVQTQISTVPLPPELLKYTKRKSGSGIIHTSNNDYSLSEVYQILKDNLKLPNFTSFKYHGTSISLEGKNIYYIIFKEGNDFVVNYKLKIFVYVWAVLLMIFTVIIGGGIYLGLVQREAVIFHTRAKEIL